MSARLLRCALVAMAALVALPLAAVPPLDLDDVLRQLREAHPHTRFEHARVSHIPGLVEVWIGAQPVYVDARAPRYVVFGHLFDLREMRDLSAQRQAELGLGGAASGNTRTGGAGSSAAGPGVEASAPLAWSDLPLADALVQRQGRGRRQLAVFVDPSCPYCRELQTELDRLDDVTIYHFIVPFMGQAGAARAAWCAPDRLRAWRALLARGAVAPAGTLGCADPLARNLALARRFGVQGTPTLIDGRGRRLARMAYKAELEAWLAEQPGAAGPPGSLAAPSLSPAKE